MELLQARELAINLGHQLLPHCDRLNIAGSIRRKQSHVKDIELVCQPKTYEEKDLFGGVSSVHRSQQFMEAATNLGKVLKGKPSGRYMQIWIHIGKDNGINLDLFMPTPEDYFRQYAIRTGSANYAHLMIATSWKRLGWVGTDEGLRLREECEEVKHGDKSTWKVKVDNPTKPPVWDSEEDFIKWLQIPYLAPQYRNY